MPYHAHTLNRQASSVLMARIQASEELGVLAGTAKPRSAKKFPEFMKSFGWCTWDAFYSQVSAQGKNWQSFILISLQWCIH